MWSSRVWMTQASPTCCQQLLRRRTPLTHCGACWDKCDWCQLRPRLCKWGLWIQRRRQLLFTVALPVSGVILFSPTIKCMHRTHDACPPVCLEDQLRPRCPLYLPPPTITHGWGGPVPGMAFRPGMTHAIPTCCQVASRTTSVRGVYCMYLHPTISTWLGWARSGHGVPPGDDSHDPCLLSVCFHGHLRPRCLL